MFYAELNCESTQRRLVLFINSSVLLVSGYMRFRDSLLDIGYLINTILLKKKKSIRGFDENIFHARPSQSYDDCNGTCPWLVPSHQSDSDNSPFDLRGLFFAVIMASEL